VLKQLIDDDSQSLAFKARVYVDVARRYRKNVASADNLTGLSNRATFMAAVEGAVRRQEKCAVLYLDLNNFKPVNDRYGHKAGDAVLREIGRRLDGLAGPNLVAGRLGGDEFALLVLVTSVKLPKLVAEIQKIVAAPMVLSGGETVAVSASVGVARYPQDARTAQALVAAADEAMYGGKKHR
jgi:diguanylate cyclase (GGDEF)-like protein